MNFFFFFIISMFIIITLGMTVRRPLQSTIPIIIFLFMFMWITDFGGDFNFNLLFINQTENLTDIKVENITVPEINNSVPNYIGNITIDTRWDSNV